MKRIPFIDLSETNCWIVYLMPFNKDDRTNYDLVLKTQKQCISDNLFGMGWSLDGNVFNKDSYLNDENMQKHIDYYSKNGWDISTKALKNYKDIKKGDYVITRIKNGSYYVGKVSKNSSFYINDPKSEIYQDFSWGNCVETWVEYDVPNSIPSEIVGRFSQRTHSTIDRVSDDKYRQKLLIIAMYENKTNNEKFTIPKLNICEKNFVRSLTYTELEDLVSLFIDEKHNSEGYKLMPSSCKISQQNFEFFYVSKNRKIITCQVKNQNSIEINNYININGYEKIYIFSGLWDDEQVKEMNKKYSMYKHIYIISPNELYKILKSNTYIFNNSFYNFDKKELLKTSDINLLGYTKRDKKVQNENEYTIDDNFIRFDKYECLFYSTEFESLILSCHFLENKEQEKMIIDKIKNDINRD